MASSEGSTLYNVSSGKPSPGGEFQSDSTSFQFYIPHYQFKIFKSKGAVVTLLWGFCCLFTFKFLTDSYDQVLLTVSYSKDKSPVMIHSLSVLLYPVLGWLADVKFGRYVMVKWGLRVMWIMSILFCIASVVLNHFELSYTSESLVRAFLYVPLTLAQGCVMASIFQLGVDQLAEASSSEITSYFRWFAWLWFGSGVSVAFSQAMTCFCSEYALLGFLFLPAVITMGIVVDCMCNHWLIKESVSDNPFALIKKVLQYAAKNKYPRLRSAFTYWDDKRYSRIDFAKNEFGGPFTLDQVEDVKTFFRIFIISVIFGFFAGLCASIHPVYDIVARYIHAKNSSDSPNTCFKNISVSHSGNIFMVMILPVYEFIFYPFFKRYVHVSILKKVGYGMVFFVLSLAACTAIEFVGNSHLPHANVTCQLADGEHNNSPIDYRWMILPFILDSVANFLFITSGIEFLCAQSPHSMKGLLFGTSLGLVGFFTVLGFSLLMLVEYIVKKWLSSNRYGCLSWYLLISLAFLLTLFIIFYFALKCYKKRLRDNSEERSVVNNY